MMAWRFAHTGLEDDGFQIAGNEIWTMDWVKVEGERARLLHPQIRDKVLTYDVYEVTNEDGEVIRFASAELSPGTFAFYWWREL